MSSREVGTGGGAGLGRWGRLSSDGKSLKLSSSFASFSVPSPISPLKHFLSQLLSTPAISNLSAARIPKTCNP